MKEFLTLNIGNSCISFCITHRSGVKFIGSFRISEPGSLKKINRALTQYSTGIIAYVSVNKTFEKELIPGLKTTGFKIKKLTFRNKLNFKNLYKTPETLGMDRTANIAAAAEYFNGDRIIIDAGTAITIDLLDKTNIFKGGIIIPGRDILSKALHSGTDLLPVIDPGEKFPFPGLSTKDCIGAGLQVFTEHGISGLLGEFRKKSGTSPLILGTGGDIGFLKKTVKLKIIPELTHLGIKKYLR